MNAYLRKEIRLLLPNFGVAVAMALSVWLIPADQAHQNNLAVQFMRSLPVIFCPALLVMMALDSFGKEISAGTFTNLLSQPVSRSRVWWTKTLLLAVAMLVVFVVWWLSFGLHLPQLFMAGSSDVRETLVVTTLILVAAFSGGLWAVLFFRQVGAAFWFTLIVPAATAMLTSYLTNKFGSDAHIERNIILALTTYSAAGFFWARHLFNVAQDVQWTGGNIALPGWLKLPGSFGSAIKVKGRRPRLALFGKELQLHQSQFVIGGILALLHITLRLLRPDKGSSDNSTVFEFVSFNFWTLWLVMPLLIGCAAVAEERKLGTLEAQLCLPARRWVQFLMKFGVAIGLTILFGLVMPLLIEGGRILPNTVKFRREAYSYDQVAHTFGTVWAFIVKIVVVAGPILPYLPMLALAVAFCCIAFYASTLSRNTLQAIAPAIMGVIIAWALVVGGYFIGEGFQHPWWRGLLAHVIGVPALTVALAWLAWWNFRRVLVGAPVWRRNLGILFTTLALVILATTVLYQRAWELLAPLETTHGPRRLNQPGDATIQSQNNYLLAHLSDGRIWSSHIDITMNGVTSMLLGNWQYTATSSSDRFMDGTNWQSITQCAFETLALHKDGSLWISETPDDPRRRALFPNALIAWTNNLVRFGAESDWKSVVSAEWTCAYAIKNDGTLWRLGTNWTNWRTRLNSLRDLPPKRLGTDADWAGFFQTGYGTAYRKSDGQVFIQTQPNLKRTNVVNLGEGFALAREVSLEGETWRRLFFSSAPQVGSLDVGLTESGTLRVFLNSWLAVLKREGVRSKVLEIRSARPGKTHWLDATVNGSSGEIIALNSDGTLWKWEFKSGSGDLAADAVATQLGTHSDWISIAGGMDGVVCLAADGSLWLWHSDERFGNSSMLRPLLRSTRHPQFVGNIFAKSE